MIFIQLFVVSKFRHLDIIRKYKIRNYITKPKTLSHVRKRVENLKS